MVIRASAPAKAINHLPACWANQCLPPRMIDTQCGLKTYDGKRSPLDIVHSQRSLTCEACLATLTDQGKLWEEYMRTPDERCHLCGCQSVDDPCRECNREIIDGIEQQVLADEGIRLIGITDAGESSRAS